MKTTFVVGLLAGFTTVILPAQSFAEDDNTPAVEKNAKSDSKSDCAWVGVYTVTLPELVSEHVGLEKGQGVSVEAVVAGSPAEKAGIMKKDILTHVDSEPITSGKALSKLVATKKPGETIVLNVRRKNESMQVNVKLAGKPERIALSGQQPKPDPVFPLDGLAVDNRLSRALQQMEEDLDRGLADALDAQASAIANITTSVGNGGHQRMEVSVADKEGRISVSTVDGDTTVKLWDTDGKVLFEGPYNTEEEKNAVPEDLRKRIERVNSENPTRLWVFEGYRTPDDKKEDKTDEEE